MKKEITPPLMINFSIMTEKEKFFGERYTATNKDNDNPTNIYKKNKKMTKIKRTLLFIFLRTTILKILKIRRIVVVITVPI